MYISSLVRLHGYLVILLLAEKWRLWTTVRHDPYTYCANNRVYHSRLDTNGPHSGKEKQIKKSVKCVQDQTSRCGCPSPAVGSQALLAHEFVISVLIFVIQPF